jgi:formyltetrahydrofolate deformylase
VTGRPVPTRRPSRRLAHAPSSLGRLVERFELPFHHVATEGLTREAHEQAVLAAVAPYAPEYLVLAKYMRVLTPDFVARYPGRIVNIHHSFLPAFIGARPYQQAARP